MSKKKKWALAIAALLAVLSLVLVANDDALYQDPIMKITQVAEKKTQQTEDYLGNKDLQTTQELTGMITNGDKRDTKITINNVYSKSQAMDQKFHPGQKIFINLTQKPDLTATVKGFKRDVPVTMMLILALLVLIFSMGKSGWLTLLSIAINTILFVLAVGLNRDLSGNQVVWLFANLALIFSFITLVCVIGWNRQMWLTFAAVVIATGLAVVLWQIVVVFNHAKGIHYESMEYVMQEPAPLFLAQILIGVLGAAMDMATDIIASLATLKKEKPELLPKQIFQSGMQIGRTIMGPLLNVLFFLFMAETLPMVLVYLRNGNSWVYSFEMNMTLGMASTLVSAIGIVLTVVLASFLASRWLGKTKEVAHG